MKAFKTGLAIVISFGFLAASCSYKTCPAYAKVAPEKAGVHAYAQPEKAR